ncbi:hypothetical protein O6H91_15G082800 [Diphasiastrum complanatum]|uniref:Uncharacterized protein n=1 Tax=Diphasiastrum complanatum TaxID=34168 RepID=A0ACC2BK68_DIPCM|nr:hypothetical protein O6H91_15G082800 [Diphasiastrum complanatum]
MAWGHSRLKNDNDIADSPDLHPRRRRLLLFISCIGVLFLFLLILTGFCIMITVLLMHPHKPRYRLQDVQITQLLITNAPLQSITADNLDPVDSTLNSDIIVTLGSYNRNHHLDIYNSRLVVILYYNRKEIGGTYFVPFYQESQNTTVIQRVLYIRDHPLRHSEAASLNASLANNAVHFQSKIAARVQFKYGTWKSSWHRWFRVNCELVLSSFTAPSGSHLLFRKC